MQTRQRIIMIAVVDHQPCHIEQSGRSLLLVLCNPTQLLTCHVVLRDAMRLLDQHFAPRARPRGPLAQRDGADQGRQGIGRLAALPGFIL